MSRIPYLTLAEMTPRQREVNELFVTERGGPVTGPVAFWMRNPELGLRHEALRLHMERATSLPRALSELAILVANRHFSAEFTWCRHLAAALRFGLEAAPLDVLRNGGRPVFDDPAAQAVHDFSREILETCGVGEATYRRVLDRLGLAATIELVAEIGYGTLLALSANTFGPEEPEPTDCTLPPAGPPATYPTRIGQEMRLEGIDPPTDLDAALAAAGDAAAVWRRAPGLAPPWLEYEAVLRLNSSVQPAMRELLALAVAGFWRCPRLWARHRPRAAEAGLDPGAMPALAAGRRPTAADADFELGWAFVDSLLRYGRASIALQDRAIARLGTTTVIEFVAITGFQTAVAMTLNTFDRSPAAVSALTPT